MARSLRHSSVGRVGGWRYGSGVSGRVAVGAVALGVLAAACGGPSNAPAHQAKKGTTSASASSATTSPAPSVARPAGEWKISATDEKYIADHKRLNQGDTTKTCHPGATKLVFWSWELDMNENVNLYNLTHPKTCVQWVNTLGQNQAVKLQAAMKSGAGVPDLFHDQQSSAANWILQKRVIDLSKYGADSLKSDFVPWVWNIVAPFKTSAVYALPWDQGPMALAYNARAFAKYHLQVPKTWAQFASEAEAVHKAHPGVYLANINNFPIEQLIWWQTGAHPIHWSGGAKLTMNYNLPGAQKAAEYWQKLWADGALANATGNGSYKVLAQSKVLTAWSPAWYPNTLGPLAGKTTGDWRVAPIPQWSSGENVQTNWGGSAVYVTTASKHPDLAYDFASWLMTSQASWYLFSSPPQLLYPTNESVLQNATYLNQTIALTGSQKLRHVYADIARHVDENWEWSPIEPEAEIVMTDEMGKVLSHKATLPSILSSIQSKLTAEAKSDGFTVSTS